MSDNRKARQVRKQLFGKGLVWLLVLLAVTSLNACGKKPGKVDPPLATENDRFPLTYPDLQTDPKPDIIRPAVKTEKKKK